MKDFWCTEYCWGTYPNFSGKALQLILKSHEGNRVELFLTDPLDIYFIKNVKGIELVGIHFKDRLKELGFNVCEPKPNTCNCATKIICKDTDTCDENKPADTLAGGTLTRYHVDKFKCCFDAHIFYRKKIELLEKIIELNSEYVGSINSINLNARDVQEQMKKRDEIYYKVSLLRKNLTELERSHGC